MRTPTKVITALALAGIAVAGGAAFTAQAGLSNDTPGGHSQYLGGSTQETITGAELEKVEYGYDPTPTTGTAVTHVIVTLDSTNSTAARGKTVNIAFTGGSLPTPFTCTNIPATGTMFSDCTGGSYTNPDGLKITVGSPTAVTVTTPAS